MSTTRRERVRSYPSYLTMALAIERSSQLSGIATTIKLAKQCLKLTDGSNPAYGTRQACIDYIRAHTETSLARAAREYRGSRRPVCYCESCTSTDPFASTSPYPDFEAYCAECSRLSQVLREATAAAMDELRDGDEGWPMSADEFRGAR